MMAVNPTETSTMPTPSRAALVAKLLSDSLVRSALAGANGPGPTDHVALRSTKRVAAREVDGVSQGAEKSTETP